MKFYKIVSALVIGATLSASMPSFAASFGRSGGSFSRSFSRPSIPKTTPAPKPSPSATPNKSTGGIGGTTGSMGVRKSEVTNQVAANKVAPAQSAPVSRPNVATSPTYSSAPTPTYGTVPQPVYQSAGPSNTSTFLSSMGGSFVGSSIANMLTGSHGSGGGGTTVINNTTGATPGASPATGSALAPSTGAVTPDSALASSVYPMGAAPVAKSYGIGDFIIDIVLFVILIVLLVAVAFMFYKGFKMIRDYINRERKTPARPVSTKQPFSPNTKFWEIQNAFANADAVALKSLLGPDLVDETTRDLHPCELTLRNVSHEVVLNNSQEFSVHYTFVDDTKVVSQVWHYELHEGAWKLNGIENI